MGSKKPRSKKGKAGHSSQTKSQVEGREKTSSDAKASSDSPLLRLPREVRDKIYDELLIARLDPSAQEQYDEVKAATSIQGSSFFAENALDHFEHDLCLMPGGRMNGKMGYKFIRDAMGLMLANKQINEEATTTLFSKNTFLILVEWERVFPFWRCENPGCQPGAPCYVTFKNSQKIKHLYIIINKRRALDDPMLKVESANLEKNLKIVAWYLRLAGNKFETLKIRYTSCFDGQIGAMRGDFEYELPKGMPDHPVVIDDCFGKNHYVERKEAMKYFFNYGNLFNPLRTLKGVAEHVTIRGDLSQKDIDDLISIMSITDPRPAIRKKRMQEKAAQEHRRETERTHGFHNFMKEMVDKHKDSDPDVAEWCRDTLKTPSFSPALLSELMRPPTQEELLRATPEQYEEHGDVSWDAVPMGGIGVINGKPVYGPPRPPSKT